MTKMTKRISPIKIKDIVKKDMKRDNEGKKKFKCELCEKSFTHKRFLKSHVTVVHEKLEQFKCEICQKTFYREGILANHIAIAHKNQNDTISIHFCSLHG